MIGWMQKHRKYLVVTIWISVIAFVGAGFVGWGAYSFGSSGGTVTEVGDIEIESREFQKEYSRLYNLYNQMLGGEMDKEKAKQLGLQQQALQNLQSQALLLNFAKEAGIRVAKEEVAREVASIDAFRQDGVFSSDIYKKVLQNNNLSPAEFEKDIRKTLLIEKVSDIISPKLSEAEMQAFLAPFSIKDRISYRILERASVDVSVDEAELRDFWEQNKERYLKPKGYRVDAVITELDEVDIIDSELQEYYSEHRDIYRDDEGRILEFEDAIEQVRTDYRYEEAEDIALKKYIDLKKERIENPKEITIYQDDSSYGTDVFSALEGANIGDTLKPVVIDGGYITLKTKEEIAAKPLPFEEARSYAKEDLQAQKEMERLVDRAQKMVNDGFAGSIGVIEGRLDEEVLPELAKSERGAFLKEFYTQSGEKGVIRLGEKVVVYQILEQQLLEPSKEEQSDRYAFVNENIAGIKSSQIQNALLDELRKRYNIAQN